MEECDSYIYNFNQGGGGLRVGGDCYVNGDQNGWLFAPGLACTEEQEHFATINIVLKLLSVYVVGW